MSISFLESHLVWVYTQGRSALRSNIMPQKSESAPVSLADVLAKIDKDRAFNFDITMELTTPSLRVGSLRVHGKVESVASRKR